MKKIKILFAINCMNIGGAPSVVFNQLRLLDKEKFDPYLLTLYPSKPANFLSQMDFLPKEKQTHFRLKNRSIFDLSTLREIYRYLKTEQFGVVYTHLFLANLIVRKLAILARVPVILAFEHSTYFNKSRWQIFADKMLSRRTDRILTSTNEVAEFTSEQLKIPLEKFSVVRNPVTIPEKKSVAAKELRSMAGVPSSAKKIFLTIGRFSEEKGQEVLLTAIHAQHKAFREKGYHFIMVGHGPREVYLRDYIVYHRLDDFVHLLHAPERAKEFLFVADWFVLPSLREGQSIVVEEAMLAGLPVLASRLPGMGEVVRDKVNGLLFNPGDWLDLAHILLTLSELPEATVKEYGKHSLASARSLFAPEARVRLFEEICLNLCKEKGILSK